MVDTRGMRAPFMYNAGVTRELLLHVQRGWSAAMWGARWRAHTAILLCIWLLSEVWGATGVNAPDSDGMVPEVALGVDVSDIEWNPDSLDRYPRLIGRVPAVVGW